ncbi:MAG TPA: DUF2332 domain-containing protein [Acidimicrobiia bacterium]|nr:DUF2332 domain-containing protein [Acidimicrobiia bacterium]
MNVDDARRKVADECRLQAAGCGYVGAPFYEHLLLAMADDALAGGPTWDLLGPYAERPFDDAYRLRVLGGVHRMVLDGDAPALAAHFPSTGGDGDAAAAWPLVRHVFRDPPPVLLDAMTRPPQTNEVGRSVSLVPGFLTVAREFGLPLRLLELGSSAGLNLRVDAYRYENDGAAWGDPSSPVRFADLWTDGRPPLDTPARIAERRGCDRDPIDATSDDARLRLLSYVWPGQRDRFELLRHALDVAARFPVEIDRADADEWVERQLERRADGIATVVFHSIAWQYFGDAAQARVRAALARAGERATVDAPVAWLRLEPAAAGVPTELRLTTWPDTGAGADRLLATAGFHFGRVRWLS